MAAEHKTTPILTQHSLEEETTVYSAGPRLALSPPSSPGPAHAFVFVVLDCVHYVAGERVTGEILLNLPHPLGPSRLILESSGREEVRIYESGMNSGCKEASSLIYRLEHTVVENRDVTEPGQFVYPFTFKLPHYCPATFDFSGEDQNGHYVKGDISYSVKVSLRLVGDATGALTHSRPVLIHSALSSLPSARPVEELNAVAGCCCFTSKGVTRFKLSLRSEEHCSVGGPIKFKLDPDNSRCSATIKSVTGLIFQETLFSIPGNRECRCFRTLFSITRATWISTSTNLIYDKDFEYITELRPPSTDQNPSSNSTPLIQCRYFVQCLVTYDVTCRAEVATITLPVHVNPRNNLERLEPKLPRVWDPQEKPILNIVADATKTYAPGSSYPSD